MQFWCRNSCRDCAALVISTHWVWNGVIYSCGFVTSTGACAFDCRGDVDGATVTATGICYLATASGPCSTVIVLIALLVASRCLWAIWTTLSSTYTPYGQHLGRRRNLGWSKLQSYAYVSRKKERPKRLGICSVVLICNDVRFGR